MSVCSDGYMHRNVCMHEHVLEWTHIPQCMCVYMPVSLSSEGDPPDAQTGPLAAGLWTLLLTLKASTAL